MKLFKSDKNSLCTTTIVGRMLSVTQLQDLKESLTDPRELFERSASILSLCPDELLRRVAMKTGLSLCERIEPEEISVDPSFPLGAYCDQGALPITRGAHTAIACVNPAATFSFPKEYDRILCRWSTLQAAYRLLETLRISRSPVGDLREALLMLCSITASYDSRSFTLDMEASTYSFVTDDHGAGTGTFERELSRSLLPIFQEKSAHATPLYLDASKALRVSQPLLRKNIFSVELIDYSKLPILVEMQQ